MRLQNNFLLPSIVLCLGALLSTSAEAQTLTPTLQIAQIEGLSGLDLLSTARVALPEPPAHLRLDAPRRSYGLPVGTMAVGTLVGISGNILSAASGSDTGLVVSNVLGSALLMGGIISLVLNIAKFRRARREHQQLTQFVF